MAALCTPRIQLPYNSYIAASPVLAHPCLGVSHTVLLLTEFLSTTCRACMQGRNQVLCITGPARPCMRLRPFLAL